MIELAKVATRQCAISKPDWENKMRHISQVNRATLDRQRVSTTLAINFLHTTKISSSSERSSPPARNDESVEYGLHGGGRRMTQALSRRRQITFTTPPASSVRVAYRDRPCCRGCPPRNGQNPCKAAIESPLDKLTMVDQRGWWRIDRALQYPTETARLSAGFLRRPFARRDTWALTATAIRP